MTAPTRAKTWLIGTGTGLSAAAVIWLYATFVTKEAARATTEQLRAEVAIPLQILAHEQCLMRYRLDVQAGVPNPGGCGK